MKVKKFKTKKFNKLLICDLIMLLICIIVTGYNLYKNTGIELIGTCINTFILFEKFNILVGLLMLVISFVYEIIYNNFWKLLIYLIFRFTRLKKILNNIKINSISDIDYYRETFTDLSPAEISLLSDLEIEKDKDISATLLSLYYKKVIDFQNNSVVIINESDNLKPSEQQVLNSLKEGGINSIDSIRWKSVAVEEAINDGYIYEAGKKHLNLNKSSRMIVLALIMFIGGFIYLNSNSTRLDSYAAHEEERNIKYLGENYEELEFEETMDIIEKNPEFLTEVKNDYKQYNDFVICFFVMMGGLVLMISIPVYKLARKISHAIIINNNNYRRTKKGDILAEQILAMKNFVHDFGNFSEKTKEHVILWDEFLIYAVILEENDEIINSIYEFKNIKRLF